MSRGEHASESTHELDHLGAAEEGTRAAGLGNRRRANPLQNHIGTKVS